MAGPRPHDVLRSWPGGPGPTRSLPQSLSERKAATSKLLDPDILSGVLATAACLEDETLDLPAHAPILLHRPPTSASSCGVPENPLTRGAGRGGGAPPRDRGFCALPEAVASLSWILASARCGLRLSVFRGGAPRPARRLVRKLLGQDTSCCACHGGDAAILRERPAVERQSDRCPTTPKERRHERAQRRCERGAPLSRGPLRGLQAHARGPGSDPEHVRGRLPKGRGAPLGRGHRRGAAPGRRRA